MNSKYNSSFFANDEHSEKKKFNGEDVIFHAIREVLVVAAAAAAVIVEVILCRNFEQVSRRKNLVTLNFERSQRKFPYVFCCFFSSKVGTV